jgi:hypothetical protein
MSPKMYVWDMARKDVEVVASSYLLRGVVTLVVRVVQQEGEHAERTVEVGDLRQQDKKRTVVSGAVVAFAAAAAVVAVAVEAAAAVAVVVAAGLVAVGCAGDVECDYGASSRSMGIAIRHSMVRHDENAGYVGPGCQITQGHPPSKKRICG